MEETPYIGFSNETLNQLPDVAAGDMVDCPHCGAQHALEGEKLLFYTCEEGALAPMYLGAVNGKLVIGVKPDASGHI